ncbi:MAG TPA: tRNA adenosine(34) deaminase TadA [Clostridiales bacterium]|jgi:tRNA(adenine34) deaminase|nr:tRNA adenosine(34) deaminase TadA [Clostridiales bacterium]
MNEYFMTEALKEAQKAFDMDEVPIGAVIVKDGKIIGRGYNHKEETCDATAHAEIMAIKEASEKIQAWRLSGCTMFVTLEPCSMCAGALVNARIDKLVIGASDPKTGACGSVFNIVQDKRLNHQVELQIGILEEECSKILKVFFERLRWKTDGR